MAADATSDVNARPGKPRVFVSYARVDSDIRFVDRLCAALTEQSFETFIDRRDIAPGENFENRIRDLIIQADAFVFVLSPDAVASEYCLKELDIALELKKRIQRILFRDVSARTLPHALRLPQWISFDDPALFDERVLQLVEALFTDFEWIRKHTEFGWDAERWNAAGRPGPEGLLLRPPRLTEAVHWIVRRPCNTPEPTEVLRAFIAASREAFDQEEVAKLIQVAEAVHLADSGDTALKLCVHAARREIELRKRVPGRSRAAAMLAEVVWRRYLVLCGHVEEVRSAAFSPDGSRVVTVSADYTARIWDAGSGKELAVLRPGKWVNSAAFSPDGSRIVTVSNDEIARIWDTGSGKELAVLRHGKWVNSAVFSPDGSRIVTVSMDRSARIWDAGIASQIAVLSGHRDWVRSAVFSPDGSRIVTVSADKTARIWDATSGKELAVLRGHRDTVLSATFSPDGSRASSQSHETKPPASGTPRAARSSRSCAVTATSCGTPPSAPTGRASSRGTETRRLPASGTPRAARSSWSCGGTVAP
jgi:predicted oxidoreductase (fatty acid repression mutant protein)